MGARIYFSPVEFETVIGLEVHVQLSTRSKMFCGCSADYAGASPNTHVCPVCLGLPGVLPTINEEAVRYTVMTALALNCSILEETKFDRKNYFYPDLMKGYQISQYDAPISKKGWLEIGTAEAKKRVAITRVHLEEDVAKLLHRDGYSLVDVNRSGVPLMEIVSEPDIRSPEEARDYLVKLRSILQYLGVSTANMEEGSFRCDANISIRPVGSSELMGKVEVKNMNSFRAVYRALSYEEERQRKAFISGEKIAQETRGWLEEGITVLQRSKEYAHDYRYFPEPDLPPLALSAEYINGVRRSLPELPEARQKRFITDYGLSPYDSMVLTTDKAMADYFESCIDLDKSKPVPEYAKEVANWLLGEFSHNLASAEINIDNSPVAPDKLCRLISLIDEGKITMAVAKDVLAEMFSSGGDPYDIVQARGLLQISNSAELEEVIKEVLANNPQAVSDYHQGKPQAIKFLVGQVMKRTKGRANPNLAADLLSKKLEVK